MADAADKPIAVLVVHGIGEQLPMDTLRRFVGTTFGPGSLTKDPPEIHSKLDRYSEFLDLRRLSLAKGGGHPRVDFYEVYWAATFGDGTVGGVIAWALRTVFRRASGTQMRHVVRVARALTTLLLVLLLAVAVLVLVLGWWSWVAPLLPLVALALFVPRQVLTGIVTRTVADASRWFGPAPRDIVERDRVRRLGLDLLRALHDAKEGDEEVYGRIVVVGHSLGSVLAYDVIRLSFDTLREPRADAVAPGPGLADRQPAAWNFDDERARLVSGDGDVERRVRAFQHFQRQLHEEQRGVGVPWRVTDFITLGSPLAHAADLWTSDTASFDVRVGESELPVCPPVGEEQTSERNRARAGVPVPPGAKDGPVAFYRRREAGPLIAHEASPFASTRWTNLYVPMTRQLGGDPVGGPLRPGWGLGVRDQPVRVSAPARRAARVMRRPVAAHTWYWRRDARTTLEDVRSRGGPPDAVQTLANVLFLAEKPPKPYTVPSAEAATPAP
jgi:hypothetical protein